MTWLSIEPLPPRVYELPGLIADRLATPRMAALLGGAGRIYTEATEPEEPEDNPDVAWGRVVVRLAGRLYAVAQEHGTRRRLVRVLVRAEINRPGAGFDPRRSLEAIHTEVFAQLEGWQPPAQNAVVAFPLWRVGPVNDDALWDEERKLWLQTYEYRCVLGPTE